MANKYDFIFYTVYLKESSQNASNEMMTIIVDDSRDQGKSKFDESKKEEKQ